MDDNDRELLELAAKAAGIEKVQVRTPIGTREYYPALARCATGHQEFDPLNNDGDALRLAVECDIAFGRGSNTGKPRIAYRLDGILQIVDVETELSTYKPPVDIVAATRRAIVRAAAEMGRVKLC